MSRALYQNWRLGRPIEDEDLGWRALRIKVATEVGCLPEQVDAMPITDILDMQAYWHAESLVSEAKSRKK